jgi:hypothetical protein
MGKVLCIYNADGLFTEQPFGQGMAVGSSYLRREPVRGAVTTTALGACLAALILMFEMAVSAQTSRWPIIQPLEEKRTLIAPGRDNADTPFVLFIKDSGGAPVYKLECHNGNYENQSEMNFSGDFQCALFAVKEKALVSGDLFAANSKNELSADWWNRGRMRAAQLRGECLKYPEYSTLRHFKLRGMLLTLQFTDIEWSRTKNQQNNPLIGSLLLQRVQSQTPRLRVRGLMKLRG